MHRADVPVHLQDSQKVLDDLRDPPRLFLGGNYLEEKVIVQEASLREQDEVVHQRYRRESKFETVHVGGAG